MPDVTSEEVASQPALWRQALTLPAAELGKLPGAGARVLALGCGTSYYILESYARRRRQLGRGLTRAAIPSELDDDPTSYDAVLFLSRSGTTADLLEVSGKLRGLVRTVALCGTLDSPLVDDANVALDLSFADESSVVQTRFATTALLVLRCSLGERLGR